MRPMATRMALWPVLWAAAVFGSAMELWAAETGRAAWASRRPNILWIIAEDMGPELGCYGAEQVWTPNLDGLAERGVRFSRAYTVTPVCSSSRSAFMTGMYATSIDAHHHRSHREDGRTLPRGVRVLTDWLRPAGYFTVNIVRLPEDVGFRGTGKTDWNFQYEGRAGGDRPFDSDRWSDLKAHQPFYAQINFPETHRGRAWDTAHERIERTADPRKVVVPPYYPDHPAVREDWAQYLNTVMALDRKVGVILDLLERDGLADSTVVVFMADHGRAMVRAKQWPYESGLRVPLIIRWPAGPPRPKRLGGPGGVDDRLIESIDLTATTLWMAGVAPPMLMQGRVFLGERAARNPPRRFAFGGRDRGDETVDRVRTVRDRRYRYIRNYHPERPFLQLNRYKEWQYPAIDVMRRLWFAGELTRAQARLMAATRPEEELYDLENDPYEVRNLAASQEPEHREALVRLRAALDAWTVETNDHGRFPEPPGVIETWERRMRENYEDRLRSRPEAYERMKRHHEVWEAERGGGRGM